MNMKKWSILLLLVVSMPACATRQAIDRRASWVGEFVVSTKPPGGITFVDHPGEDQASFHYSGLSPVRVSEDRAGWLRIQDGHRSGWVEKDSFVLSRDVLQFCERQLRANPDDAWALYLRGTEWAQAGKWDLAIADFDRSLLHDTTSGPAFNNRGISWLRKGELDKALDDFDRAISINPDNTYAWINNCSALRRKHEYEHALRSCNEAVRLDPTIDAAYLNRGNVWRDEREYEKARADYEQALRLGPDIDYSINGLAWFLATCPDQAYRDGKRAVKLARKAVQLTHRKDPGLLDTLAAAHAEAGDFDGAVECEREIMRLPGLDPSSRSEASKRLKMYEERQPYRE